MEGNIPVPAESLRTIAEGAAHEARQHDGALRRSLEQSAAEAFDSLEGKDGEFVSISGKTVSRLTAFGGDNWRHRDAAAVFLRQYGVWSTEE